MTQPTDDNYRAANELLSAAIGCDAETEIAQFTATANRLALMLATIDEYEAAKARETN